MTVLRVAIKHHDDDSVSSVEVVDMSLSQFCSFVAKMAGDTTRGQRKDFNRRVNSEFVSLGNSMEIKVIKEWEQ